MVAFGFGEVSGGALQGWFIDAFSSKNATILNLMVVLVMTLATIASVYFERFNALTFFMSYMWGLQDGVFNTHTFQVLGSEFATQSEPFGVFNLV